MRALLLIQLNAFFALSLCLISSSCHAMPTNEHVLLRWKAPAKEPMAFNTTMDAIDEEKRISLEFNFDNIFKNGALSSEEMDLIKPLKAAKHQSMVTLLNPLGDNRISVKMISKKFSRDEEDVSGIFDMLESMEGSVVMRGEISDSGSVTSFYFDQHQKNLVSMFFQLPEEPVKKGDTWAIDVNLIKMGHGFICDTSNRTNVVKLVSIEKDPAEKKVAALEYSIAESVKGVFVMPTAMMNKMSADTFDDNPFKDRIPTTMEAIFVARAEFYVDEGTWKSFNGRLIIRSSGMMEIDTEQIISLEAMESVPEELLELE